MRCSLHLSSYSIKLWGSLNALTRGWTESSISLELTKTGASGEKLECYGSSVSHGVHASRETQQSRQGSTSHLSLLLSLVPIWINSCDFFSFHHKAAYSFTSLVHLLLFGHKVLNWLCVETSLNVATSLSDLGKYLFLQLLWFFFPPLKWSPLAKDTADAWKWVCSDLKVMSLP